MPAAALALAATLLSFAVDGNRVEFRLDRGSADLTWLSPDSFRFRRSLDGALAPVRPAAGPVAASVRETATALILASAKLEIEISRRAALVTVRERGGSVLMRDATEPRPAAEGVFWAREMPAGIRVYGLGPRSGANLDLRGSVVSASVPFLFTTAGYGEYHAGSGAYQIDFTGESTYEIHAPRVDYFFYHGPSPKAIFEERQKSGLPAERTDPAYSRPLSRDSTSLWRTLGEDIEKLTHAALSGVLSEAFPVAHYAGATGELRSRVLEVASLAPGPSLAPGALRARLSTFYQSYAPEKGQKGYPMWRPLPFQFPDDPECARHADEFMLGDELLVAPIHAPGGKREVYLPPGVWTNLETNQSAAGRQTIAVTTASLPVFARNGTIVPFDAEGGVDLHYFPKLGAEFYLLESGIPAWSVAHAAPAGDVFRLEIESKAARRYRWVVHHVDRPSSVGFEDTSYRKVSSEGELTDQSWYYDPHREELHVTAEVKPGEDRVIHVEFE